MFLTKRKAQERVIHLDVDAILTQTLKTCGRCLIKGHEGWLVPRDQASNKYTVEVLLPKMINLFLAQGPSFES